ncbi:MAG: DUF1836 domain-containing protein [Clostridiales Family XIII bacterium]|nr:DUF1836 domain-containing protein [Clostridiales Family XIII bacterium]
MRYEEYIKNFADVFTETAVIDPEDFPTMPLYADQAATFISERLKIYGKDPLLTGTMISNYVKHDMLPSPRGRKYDRDQLIMMELILCLKMTFRMTDIEAIMRPLVDNFDSKLDDKIDFFGLYKNLVPDFKAQRRQVADGIIEDMESIKERLRELDPDDDDAMEIFLVLMSIAMKVDTAMYMGKRLLRTYYETRAKNTKNAKRK